jgi:tetratricopeptide (TPR) repeat protein
VASQDTALRPRLLLYVAQQQYRLDRFGDAQATARKALAAARDSDDEARSLRRPLLNVLGSAALRLGRLDEARAHYGAILELTDEEVTTRDRAVTLDHLSLTERRLGSFDEALRLALEAIVLQRRIGEPAILAMGLNNLASLYMARSELEAAEPVLIEARALCERGGLSATLCLVLANLCEVALARGDLDAAARYGKRGIELACANGQRMVEGALRADLGQIALRRGDTTAARESIATACEIALTLEAPGLKAVAVTALAHLLRQGGQLVAARRVLALATSDSALAEADRAGLERLHLQWGTETLVDGRPGLTLDAVLQRAAIALPSGHAALIALLGD